MTRSPTSGPRRVPPGFVVGAVLLQLAVPIVAWIDGVPSRFGFHMYSGHDGLEVTVRDLDGRPLDVDLDDYLARGRTELDWTGVLPEAICDRLPQAAAVTVRSGDKSRTVTCAP